jgi:membrane-bound lytic murein transglycosylase D
MLVKAGSTLLVPRSSHRSADVSGEIADNATMMLAPDRPPGRRVTFKAGKSGDSVVAVARRYRVTAEQVASWNNVAVNARFRPGQTIVVMQTASKKGSRSAAVPASKTSAASAKSKPTASSPPPRSGARVATTNADSKL